MASTARLTGIWEKRAHGGVMDARRDATLVAGKGLAGDVSKGGRRQVTLLSAAHWRSLTAHLSPAPEPAVRRANLLVDGLDLRECRGRIVRVGQARIRILGETRPCHQMDEACPGLQAALSGPWGGGAFGEVVESGDITVGDPVAWDDADAS